LDEVPRKKKGTLGKLQERVSIKQKEFREDFGIPGQKGLGI